MIIRIVKTYYKYLLLVLWMILIFMLSSEVSTISSARSSFIAGSISSYLPAFISVDSVVFFVRKSAHIFAYFVLGILTYNVSKDCKKITFKSMFMFSYLFVLLYAISDEIHQLFVPGRSCELRDVLIDFTASVVGILIYIRLIPQ